MKIPQNVNKMNPQMGINVKQGGLESNLQENSNQTNYQLRGNAIPQGFGGNQGLQQESNIRIQQGNIGFQQGFGQGQVNAGFANDISQQGRGQQGFVPRVTQPMMQPKKVENELDNIYDNYANQVDL